MSVRAAVWLVLGTALAGALAAGPARAEATPAPPLPSDPKLWLGEPQSWQKLRGKVVLLDVWTFG